MKTFTPSRLKCARQRRGVTRRDLAASLGVQAPTVRRWEEEITTPSEETIQRISFVLRFPFEFFFGDDIEELRVEDTSLRFHL